MNRTSQARHQNMSMETAVNQIEVDTDVDGEKTVMKTGTIDAERMLQVFWITRGESLYEAAPKLTPCISIPQPQEEQIEHPIQIKHEPELILEPEELPDSEITDAEAITNGDEPLVARRKKINPNKCYICNKVFDSFEDVRLHLSEHADMIPYQCSACWIETGQELKILSLRELHNHFRMHVSPIKCPVCPHLTFSRESMKTHMRNYHQQSDQVEYICEQCGKKYVREEHFHKHMRTHKAVDEGRFPCSYCDKRLPCKNELIQHERIHTGEKPYQCYACVKSFRLSWHLRKHISRIHVKSKEVNNGPILSCKFEGCDFSTTKRYKYKYHKEKHDLRVQCPQCSKRFPYARDLRRHQHVHTGVKLFQCKQCDKSFQEKLTLHKHISEHNIDRPYSGEIDEKRNLKQKSIRKHVAKHIDARISEQNLKENLLIHAADQPSFECRHCTKKFSFRSTLAKHQQTHFKPAVKLIDPDTDVAEEPTVMKTEASDAKKMLQGCRDNQRENPYGTAPKPTSCVSIPQPQEEHIELPAQIKHEPELIQEPQELPA